MFQPSEWWFPRRIRKPDARIISNQLFPEPQIPSGASLIFLWKVLLWSCRKKAWTHYEVTASWLLTGSLLSNDLLIHMSWKKHLFVWCFLVLTKVYSFKIHNVQIYSKYAQFNISNLLKQQGMLTTCIHPGGWARLQKLALPESEKCI